MKKRDQKRLDEALDRALAPPRQRPKQSLDTLLEEYDESPSHIQSAPQLSIRDGVPTGIPTNSPAAIPNAIASESPDAPAETSPSRVARRRTRKAEEDEPDISPEQTAPLDATHTNAEKVVYSIMYRETVSKGISERHFGPAELMKRTGIRSRNTIHKALYGLLEKLSIKVISEAQKHSVGHRYYVYKPQEIEQRRKAEGMRIDPQTKLIVERAGVPLSYLGRYPSQYPSHYPSQYPSQYPKNWDTGIPKIGILYKIEDISEAESKIDTKFATASSSILAPRSDDDEAFAGLISTLKQTATEVTGREPSGTEAERWRELGELLSAELKIAASRTAVSSVPAFLTAHLRRRLFRRDLQQIEREVTEAREAANTEAEGRSERPHLSGEEVQACVNEMARLLSEGRTPESLDEEFSGGYKPTQWQIIRSMAMAQHRAARPGQS
jgi:hypothetical protein